MGPEMRFEPAKPTILPGVPLLGAGGASDRYPYPTMTPEAHRTPIYEQIAAPIRHRILSGELAEGQPVPSLAEIMADWNVHKETARRALDSLRADGLIVSRPGLPTLVAAIRMLPADGQVASELGVPEGTQVRVTATDVGVLFSRP